MSKVVMAAIGFPLTVNPVTAPADLIIVDAVSFGGCFIFASLLLKLTLKSNVH